MLYVTPTQRYFRVQKRGHCRHFRWWWEWVEIGREKIRKLVKSGQAGAFGRVLPPRTASPQIITYWANTPYSLSITRISILTTPLLQPALDITILTSWPLKNLSKQLHTTFKCVCLCFCVCECWGRELWLNSHRVTEEMITRITNLCSAKFLHSDNKLSVISYTASDLRGCSHMEKSTCCCQSCSRP